MHELTSLFLVAGIGLLIANALWACVLADRVKLIDAHSHELKALHARIRQLEHGVVPPVVIRTPPRPTRALTCADAQVVS